MGRAPCDSKVPEREILTGGAGLLSSNGVVSGQIPRNCLLQGLVDPIFPFEGLTPLGELHLNPCVHGVNSAVGHLRRSDLNFPMSEEDQQTPQPPKKEAEDAPEAPAPAPAPAPTIPLKPASNAPRPAAPTPAAPAPTVQLKVPGASSAPKTTPLKTQPLASGVGVGDTQELPKATVQLGAATQALGAPTALSAGQAATLHTAGAGEDEEPDTLANILSIVAFVFALAVLGLQLSTTSKWVSQEEPVNHPSGWNALIE